MFVEYGLKVSKAMQGNMQRGCMPSSAASQSPATLTLCIWLCIPQTPSATASQACASNDYSNLPHVIPSSALAAIRMNVHERPDEEPLRANKLNNCNMSEDIKHLAKRACMRSCSMASANNSQHRLSNIASAKRTLTFVRVWLCVCVCTSAASQSCGALSTTLSSAGTVHTKSKCRIVAASRRQFLLLIKVILA